MLFQSSKLDRSCNAIVGQPFKMGILKKRRRKILIFNETFYWCVKQNECLERHNGARYLQIINEDKSFFIEMPLEQKNQNFIFDISKRSMKGTLTDKDREVYPNYQYSNGITPGYVNELIYWCLKQKS